MTLGSPRRLEEAASSLVAGEVEETVSTLGQDIITSKDVLQVTGLAFLLEEIEVVLFYVEEMDMGELIKAGWSEVEGDEKEEVKSRLGWLEEEVEPEMEWSEVEEETG